MYAKDAKQYDNTPSVKERWPKLTLMELAEGQNKINGYILATTYQLHDALERVIARLDALEGARSKGVASAAEPKETASLRKAVQDAGNFIKGIGGKEPPGCQLPAGFGG